MNTIWLFSIVLITAFFFVEYKYTKQVEPFSFEIKSSLDGKMFKKINIGAEAIMNGISSQASKLKYGVVSSLPFRHKLREFKRTLRGRNM